MCERWLKDGVKDGVLQRWCGERGCVKDGVLRRWCVTKMVCERGCAKDGVPRLPRKVPRRHGRLKPAQARHPVP